jgi:tRNA-dihydrouridine synthase
MFCFVAQVRTVSAAISVPLFVKIRLLNTVDETITLVRQLHEAGAYLIAVHARHRVPLGQKPRAVHSLFSSFFIFFQLSNFLFVLKSISGSCVH